VILLSNAMAMLFQAAAVRLGVAGGVDLAQACRRHFAPGVSLALWLLCEVAIVACNVAEVIGMAIGLNLLFAIPLGVGVVASQLLDDRGQPGQPVLGRAAERPFGKRGARPDHFKGH